MKSIETYGNIDSNGTLTIANRERLTDWCKANKGKQVKIKFESKAAKRSLPQNDYYHAVVVESVRQGFYDIGYYMNHDQTHEFIKRNFNPVEIPNKDGVLIEVPGSTTELNKVEFGEFIERIAQWAAEYLGVVIAAPDKDYKMKL